MNSWQFYSNIDKYKANSISHAGLKSVSNLATVLKNMKNYGYYNKIDNFYGPGKSRYFYSKDEWDAYQREKDAMYQKAKANVKARDEAIEAARPKNKVEQAQYARQQEEKKGQRTSQKMMEKAIAKKTTNSLHTINNILDTINAYSKSKETKHKIEELRKKYDLKAGYEGPYGYIQDEKYKKIIDPYINGDKSKSLEDNINVDNDFYEKSQIQHEWSQKYYKDLMNDVKDIIRNDDSAWLMYELMNNSAVTNAMNNNAEVYDVITKALRDLNMDNAETWDNSKNIKTWK